MPEQPELTIQGWGPAAGPRDATVTRGADGDSARLELTTFPDLAEVLPKAARRHLSRELGWTPRRTPPVPVSEIRLAPSRLAEDCRLRLVELLGEEHVSTDREARLRHAGGKSYLDLLRRREGDASDAPDAVVRPGSTEETAALLALCSEIGVVAVPFGGGTSVVGGCRASTPTTARRSRSTWAGWPRCTPSTSRRPWSRSGRACAGRRWRSTWAGAGSSRW